MGSLMVTHLFHSCFQWLLAADLTLKNNLFLYLYFLCKGLVVYSHSQWLLSYKPPSEMINIWLC